MNHINICPSCEHRKTCVLTTQKDKVWSCSEFDEIILTNKVLKKNELLGQKKGSVLELVQ
ncbi:hypothetical protein [Psychroserpens sp. S379A]|uniref:hypothetical protein n=1 Tax=Psychroserpens sp. S379A TaxID=3415137 RepID=UPI003C7ABD45